MTGATSLVAGAAGLAPAPAAGKQNAFLRGDASWADLAAVALSGSFADLSNRPVRGISCPINGGGSVIATGVAGFLLLPFAGTITGWTLLGTPSGSLTVDIWAGPLASFGSISGANTICAGTPPAISSGVQAQGSALTGWTTAIAANTALVFNVVSASGITAANLVLNVAV